MEDSKPKIVVLPLSQMRKVSELQNSSGEIIDSTVLEPGQSRFDLIKEQRRQRLGL